MLVAVVTKIDEDEDDDDGDDNDDDDDGGGDDDNGSGDSGGVDKYSSPASTSAHYGPIHVCVPTPTCA